MFDTFFDILSGITLIGWTLIAIITLVYFLWFLYIHR